MSKRGGAIEECFFKKKKKSSRVIQWILQGIMGRMLTSKRKAENYMLCIIPGRIPRGISHNCNLPTYMTFVSFSIFDKTQRDNLYQLLVDLETYFVDS